MRETICELEEVNNLLKTKCNSLESQIELLEKCHAAHNKQIKKNERFFNKNNLRIMGIKHFHYENCVNIAKALFKEITDRDINIERSHRDSCMATDKDRHILVKVASYQDKLEIIKKANQVLKGRPDYLTDDLHHNILRKKIVSCENHFFSTGLRLRFYMFTW